MIQPTFRLPESSGTTYILPASDLNTKVIIKNSAGKDELCFPIIHYGMYHAIVHKSEDETKNNLFVFAKNNMYTHFDLRCAQKLNLRIELVQDGTWNAYIYSNEVLTIRGDYYFGNFVSTLYELKKLVPKVKLEVLNPLWGFMSKKNRSVRIHNSKESIDLYKEGFEFKSIELIKQSDDGDDDVYSITSESKEKRFSSNFARICFLTSFGRMKLVDKILSLHNESNCLLSSIVRIHTDSITLSKELKDIKLDENLGGWKFEKEKSGELEVFNVNIMM